MVREAMKCGPEEIQALYEAADAIDRGGLWFANGTRVRQAADELQRLQDIVRQVPGYCDVCTNPIEDYQRKYDLHGPMADFCSQGCFDAGTVKP